MGLFETQELPSSTMVSVVMARPARPRKALSRGSCQACAQVQKLPRGLIAKHGHTVSGSMFHGICMGSDSPPFERTCSLVVSFIDRTRTALQKLEYQAEQMLLPAAEPKGWVHEYQSFAKNGQNGGSFEWLYTTITQRDDVRLSYLNSDGAAVPYPFAMDFVDVLDACTRLNAKYREQVVLKEIARDERYILWQERRVASWALAALLPRDPDDAPEQATFFDLDLAFQVPDSCGPSTPDDHSSPA